MSDPLTLLFTDIEGSTRLLQRLGEQRYLAALDTYRSLLRAAFRSRGGREVDGTGDAFFFVFDRAVDAVDAALLVQRALAEHPWPNDAAVRIRIGIHSGEPILDGDNYVGLDVNHTARLCSAGHGGQVLLSEATRAQVETALPPELSLRDLGLYRLRDIANSERIAQLVAPGLVADFPPLRTLAVIQHNLPVQRTAIIGRERELAALQRLLQRDETGLVTLSGPGGTGKTRLALEVAGTLLDQFKDGVYFAALAPIGEPGLVASAIVRTLGLQEAGATPLEETLQSHLRHRHLLLVLDNFEHLLAASALVAGLLANCRGLKILVTSRAVLQLRDEQDFPVPPLSLPALDVAELPERLSQYSAIALFGQRALAVKPDFTLTPANSRAVVEVCRRLDGLPLAIELAAARVRLLSPQAMLDRLERRLPLLTSTMRDLPARHQTLRAAIGWSYDLLDPAEKALFRRLAVFVDGWTLEAAEVVCGGAGPVAEPMDRSPSDPVQPPLDVFECLASLASKSLVQQKSDDATSEPRFSMLETIREFGLDQAEANGEFETMRRQHAAYYLVLAEEGERQVGGPEQAAWLACLDQEHPNFRAALTWSLQTAGGDPGPGPRLAAALWVFWFRRGHLQEGSRWLQQALAVNREAPAPIRARLLTADGSIARLAGEFPRAEQLLEAGADVFRQLSDTEGVAWALSHLGLVKQWRGALDLGVEMLEESLALRRPLGNQRDIARSLFNLGVAEHFRSNYGRAAERYTETLEVQRRVGDIWGMGRVFAYLGEVALRQGDTERAAALCEEGLPLSRKVSDNWGVALALESLGGVALARGDARQAVELLKDSLVMFRDVGARDRAAQCLQDLAGLTLLHGDTVRGTRLSAAAEATQQSSGLAFWPEVQARREQDLAAARSCLGEPAFAVAWVEGWAMNLDSAVAYALGTRVVDSPHRSPL